MKAWQEYRNAPSSGTLLCSVEELKHLQVKEFQFGDESPFPFRMFVFNDNGSFIAYRNACPHYDVPLNHTTEEILTTDKKHFQCITHFAIFDKHSGLCVEGPCEGESLQTIPLCIEDDQIFIAESNK